MMAQALDALDQMMSEQAESSAALADNQLSPAEAAQLAQMAAENAALAQAAAQQALAQAAQAQAQAMAEARADGSMTSPTGQSAQEQAMAQAMAQSQSQPGQPQQGQPGQPSQPGQASESAQGAQLQNGAAGDIVISGAPNPGGPKLGENWSKLPPKVAKDIIEAQRQGVAPEYRSAVESYYKALADRARKKKNP